MRGLVWRIVLTVLGLFFVGGCAPRSALVVPARYMVEIESGSGFFVYTTAATATRPEDVKIYLSSSDSLLQAMGPVDAEGGKVYPIYYARHQGIFLNPDSLVRAIGGTTDLPPSDREFVELGQFQHWVTGLSYTGRSYLEPVEEIFEDGYSWMEPTPRLKEKLRESLEKCRKYAADYGADAIIEVQVGNSPGELLHNGKAGLMLHGVAIKYLE